MSVKIFGKKEIGQLVSCLSESHNIFGPVVRGNHVSFHEISDAGELQLDYVTTTMPPKKVFHRRETIVRYEGDGGFSAPEMGSGKPILLFGVHPCDLNAILQQDRLFSGDYRDAYYLKRRENSVIVALNCTEPGDSCFCASIGTGPSIDAGFDILLTDIGDKFLVEAGTQKGKDIIGIMTFDDATGSEIERKSSVIEEASAKFVKSIRLEGLGEVAKENPDHEVWAQIGEEGGLAGCFSCLSCGNCSLVCPTCYCYEVADIPDLDLKGGVRVREVDSCQLNEYAMVALNHNFRADRKERTRHWMMCKFGAAAGGMNSRCVGCGRCIRACPAHIDLTEVAKSLWGE